MPINRIRSSLMMRGIAFLSRRARGPKPRGSAGHRLSISLAARAYTQRGFTITQAHAGTRARAQADIRGKHYRARTPASAEHDHVAGLLGWRGRDQVGMHRRALNRKLAAAETTFRQKCNEARRDLACQLLENTRTVVTDIAAILGYADPAGFTRVFHRWTG